MSVIWMYINSKHIHFYVLFVAKRLDTYEICCAEIMKINCNIKNIRRSGIFISAIKS